jgi:hypothetical protein
VAVVSYRAGIFGLESLGIPSGPPRIICDDCGLVYPIGERRPPPEWFFDRKAPPGWGQEMLIGATDEPQRWDYCPRCLEKHPNIKKGKSKTC